MKIELLRQELGVGRLDDIHNWLWLVGRPMPPRPLHYQKAARRDAVVHEQMDLHLVWDDQRMFLKPIPRYLFDLNFWQDNLSCEERRTFASKDTTETNICERCQIYKCAVGFLLSYASLISYESDLRLAKDANLVPAEVTWPEWRLFIKELLTPENRRNINKRYIYGELRLERLNKIYRYTLRSPIRRYLYGYNSYDQFWYNNLARIFSLFAYIAIVLTAMQVGLATNRLQDNNAFQRASYGFTVFSILAPLAFVGLFFVVFVIIFLFNLFATLKYRGKRIAAIEESRGAITA